MRRAILVTVLWLTACGTNSPHLAQEQPNVEVARAALRGGSPQVALQILSNTLSRAPDNGPALLVQGDALTAMGQYEQAELTYDKILRREPDSVGANIGVGRIRLASDPAAAEVIFLKVLHRDPHNTTALSDMGVARDLLGRHKEAQAAYQEALAMDPQFFAAQVNLALSLAMTGRSDDAIRMLRPLASTASASPKLRHDLAAALAMAGNRDEASRILSADLSPDEVRQALNAYASAKVDGGPAVVGN